MDWTWALGLFLGVGMGYWGLVMEASYSAYYRAGFAGETARLRLLWPTLPRDPRAWAALILLAAWIPLLISRQGWSLPALSGVVIPTLLVGISLIDWSVRRIPNHLLLVLLAWAGLQLLWMPVTPVGLLLGGGLGFGVFFLIAMVRPGAMGFGDVKLVGVIGALVGVGNLTNALFVGIIAGGVVALVLLLLRRANRQSHIAYGPYLALGCWVALAQMLW